MAKIFYKSSERSCITGGRGRYIILPSRRSDTSQNVVPILEVFEMLRVISAEKAFQFYHRNRSQLTEIFYIIAYTAD